MPLGDSITQGVGGSTPLHGYRNTLAGLMDAAGIAYDFVGTLSDGTGFDPNHQGVSGASASLLALNIESYLTSTDPDMVLIHTGTNDIGSGEQPSAVLNSIASIVEAIHGHNSAAKILLSGIIPPANNATGDQLTRDLNALIDGFVNQKRAAGYDIRFVDHYSAFTNNSNWLIEYMADDFHPNDEGYRRMATTYFAAVQSALQDSGPNVVDDFNRSGPELGANWSAHPAYAIVSDQLANTSTQDAWGQMAVWTAKTDPGAVAFKWGVGADARGINEGGFALRLSGPSANASGYLVWLGTSAVIGKKILLWTIENGAPAESIQDIDYSQPEPTAGDIFQVELRTDSNGHHFLCYVNGVFYGQVTDPDKRQGGGYAGVMLKGNLNNDIDDFAFVASAGGDNIPPAATTDLAVQSVGPTSVTLKWTAPGDDDVTGTAAAYEVRYATAPIDLNNFSAAALAPGAPTPSAAGSVENITIGGLSSNTQYYFALKTKDEAGNLSDLSNVVSATPSGGSSSGDDFERTELGPNWTAHPAFKIVNGELRNTSTQESWNFLAVYNAKKNPVEVGFKWGTMADEAGIDEGGFALMLDAASTTANGYLIWRRPTTGTIELWTIVNGAPAASVASTQGSRPNPAAGDVMKVALRSDVSGHHFDLFINNQLDGTVTDFEKLQGKAASLYAGVMMHGNRNNPIDNFSLTVKAGAASKLVYVSGNNQVGTPGQQLPNPFVVQVTDDNGIPVKDVAVTFVVTAGGGSLSNAQPVLTNATGQASTFLTISTTQALNKVEARSAGLAGSPFVFTASAKPGDPKTLVKLSGDGQSGSGGQTLPNPIQVMVKDNLGAGVPNHPVTFTVTAGGGSINLGQSSATVNTDAQGIAQVTWKLGTPGAAQTLRVNSGFNGSPLSGSPLTFTASTSPPSKVTLASGNAQLGSINTPLPKPFVVLVQDANGNPVGGQKVTFTVVAGNGNLNGKSTIDVLSDGQGKASVTLTMGSTPRTVNRVRATSSYNGNVLPNSPITFSATAIGLKSLSMVSGNNQSGVVGTALAQPFKAKVLDSLNVGIRNYNVTFKVTSGGGKLGGTDTTRTVKTDTLGIASVTLTLGPKAGTNNNKVRAETNPALSGSPVTFQASGQTGSAQRLVKVSGDSIFGVVGNPLPAPFVAKVTDNYGNPIANIKVTFTVKAGGGNINGANQAIVTTQDNGQAQVTLTLGKTSGKFNNVVEARAFNGTKELTNSPMSFVATAAPTKAYEINIVAGGRQEGKTGEKLPSPLSVKVRDAEGNGIPTHPVRFQIQRGGGRLGNNATDTTVTTDATGVARINWYLGGAIKPDSQIVNATANNGITALRNSPLKFVAFATVGSPSVDGSFVLANPSTIPADGVTTCQVTIHVCDKFGNSIAGVPVIIEVSGDGNNIKQPANPTGSLGKAQGSFTTTRSGTKTVTAKIIGGIAITRGATVEVKALDARAVNPAGGNSQTGNTSAALPQPLAVKVSDKNGNGVPNYEVLVKVEQGGGKLYDRNSGQVSDSLRARTDAVGIANIVYICGPTPMENRIRVSAPGLANSPFLFLAQAIRPQPAKLAMISGNQQQGTVGEMLAQPIVARVTDNSNRPVFGVPVSLNVTLGGGSVNQQSQVTVTSDVFGEARGSWRLGAEAGLNYLRAESAGLTGSPIDFEANAAPDRASLLRVVSGDPAYGDVNGQSQPLAVRTVDALGNGVDGIAVIFELVEGAGTLTDNYVVSSGGG
ncbi:Ig-like domain-containing protein, partial [candidate division KSB1 bacterium]|nr:Ig-like domain-containing protein [candidate division KSB1 bacterium]